MTTRHFTEAELNKLFDHLDEYAGSPALQITHIDTSRGDNIYDMVFEADGKLWNTTFRTGLTEMQDNDPMGYGLDCKEVEAKQVWVDPIPGYWKTEYH